ncbi:MAG: hypothetical protein SVU32_06185 [Candidatus Nanohaloarchaea archaeon]|nr:hypothetical protein [Candidatus Nanohaloarchaea archaeon]
MNVDNRVFYVVTGYNDVMLNPVSEPIVKHILPALRSVVAEELSRRGYSQTEIAELMDLTQPAVSQYLNHERGRAIETIKGNEVLYEKAQDIAEYIARRDEDAVRDAYRDFCSAIVYQEDFERLTGYRKEYFMDII